MLDGDEESPLCRSQPDCDNDGLGDATDPNDQNQDIDGDTILDGNDTPQSQCWEVADCDGDGINDDQEQEPICVTDEDCDDDGLLDPDDDDDVDPDQDADGVADGDEEDESCITLVDCDDDETNDADDPDDLNPNIPEQPPEDTDGDGVIDDNEQDESCIDTPDCDDDNLPDLPDRDDTDPDQDDDGVLDGNEQAPICINDPDCDNDGIPDGTDDNDLEIDDGANTLIVDPEPPSLIPGEDALETEQTPKVLTRDDCGSNQVFDEDGNNGLGNCLVIITTKRETTNDEDTSKGSSSASAEPEKPQSTGTCADGSYYDDESNTCVEGDPPKSSSPAGRALAWLFVGWGALLAYPLLTLGGATAAALPWWWRFRSLFATLGGSTGPFLFVAWRRGWYCQHCEKKIKDKDVDACEHCGEDITSETGLEPKRSFSFPQYLRLVWANRENKDVLERLKTDQDYVYALLADLEKTEHS